MALRNLLQPLKSAQPTMWHLVITPDPRKYKGLQRLDTEPGTREFRMSLKTNIDADKYSFDNPMHGLSSNIPSVTPKMRLFQRKSESKWIRVVATDQKTPDGSLPRAALMALLNKFPTYKFQSQEEASAAILDMEQMLNCVAISEDGDGDSDR